MRKFIHRNLAEASYIRNFVFGVEDSIVSTAGLLSGVAVAGVEGRTIFITGVILIFVEAFSMAVGSFLSEYSAEEYLRERMPFRRSFLDGVVMFFSYLVSGLVPLGPYMLLSDTRLAFTFSVALSLLALLCLGVASGKITRQSAWKGALRMLLAGGLAIAVGIAIGRFVEML